MIPKVIHYCWLSKEEKPQMILDCIQSWKRVLPDYEIICWDKERFDSRISPFVQDAIAAKKWAFAADYIRLYALYHHGGIYLDSDVMVFKSFDKFLSHRAFSSIEFHPIVFFREIKKKGLFSSYYNGVGIDAAVMGSEKGHPFFGDCIDFYNQLQFKNDPGYFNTIIMPRVLAKIAFDNHGFRFSPNFQILKNDFYLYPSDVFSNSTHDSVIRHSIHLGANSWGGGKPTSLMWRLRTAIKDAMMTKFPFFYEKVRKKQIV